MRSAKIYATALCWMLATAISIAQETQLAALLDSAYSMRLQADFEANFRLLTEAERLEEVADSPVLRAKLYAELSKYYLGNTAYDQAKSYADRNLKAAVESGVSLAQAYGHTSLATYYNFLNVGDVAVDHAQRALQILRSENDPSLAARAYYILYGLYYIM